MELTKYKLGDIADISVGFPFESERFNEDGVGVRLVRGMNVSERTLRFGDESRWWSDITENLEPYFLKENDIVIGMDGSKVGKNFALIKQDDLPLLLVQRVACIRAKKGFDQNYIWHYVSSPRFIEYVNTIKTGSAIPHISGKQIGEFPIFVPSLPDQKKAASVLSALGDKIALNKKMNQKLEAMAKRLYDYWFVQYDFPDKNGHPYKNTGGKMEYNPTLKREIPEGWEVKTIGDYLKIGNGRDHSKLADGLYPVYGSGGVMRYVAEFLHDGETVLFPRKGTLNNVMYRNESLWTVDTMFYTSVLVPHSALFVFYSAKMFDFERLNTGTGVPSMTSDIIKKLPIISPDKQTLEQFDMTVAKLYNQIHHNEKEISRLTKLRDKLLPLLMNGQVVVG